MVRKLHRKECHVIDLQSRFCKERTLGDILHNSDGSPCVYLISEMTQLELKCFLSTLNQKSDHNSILIEELKTSQNGDKFLRYNNPYRVDFTDVFSVYFHTNQVKLVNFGLSCLIICESPKVLTEILP
jgi:hypothetical protein